MSFLALDDPGHLRLRTLVSKGFTPRRIRELEGRVIEIAVQHLDAALAVRTRFDYVDDFAGKLPMDVISELMGVPDDDRVRIRALADGVMHRDDGVKDVPAEAIQASADLLVYYADMVAAAAQEAVGRPDLGAGGGRDRRRPAHRRRDHGVPVPDGRRRQRDHHETACQRRILGLQEPRSAGPGLRRPLAGQAVGRGDAALRRVEPDPGPRRLRRHDAVRHHDPRGRRPAAAARFGQPRRAGRSTNPDDYRIGRDIGSKLLSFGSGAHFCLGAHLARMEAQVALDRTVQAHPRLRGGRGQLGPRPLQQRPRFRPSAHHRPAR